MVIKIGQSGARHKRMSAEREHMNTQRSLKYDHMMAVTD
jgi:hypothetical protein